MTSSLGDVVAALGEERPPLRLVLGSAVSIDWPSQTVAVRLAGAVSTVPARMAGQVPRVGEPVWVLVGDGIAVTVGRPSRPAQATVQADPVNGRVRVKARDDVFYDVGFPTGYTPAAGHNVLVNWDEGGHIIARTDIVAPPPTPGVETGVTQPVTRRFNPTASGSKRSGGGWQSGSVYYGSSFSSAGYIYGAQIANSIPDTATVTAVSVYLEVISASGAASMTLSLHTSLDVPGGDLALDQTINIGAMPNGFRGDVSLPLGWGDLLKTGARLGIGTTGPGLRVLKGVPTSGILTITTKE